MKVLRRAFSLLPGLVFLALVLAALEYLTRVGVINRALFPPPSVVAGTFWGLVADGTFVRPLGATMALFAAGYLVAVVCGIVLGLLMGTSQTVNHLLDPLIESIRPMPKAALVPVLMLFLGFGAPMMITAVALASFFPVLINTIQGVRGTDSVLIATGRTFGLGRTAITFKIILPAAMPYIFAGMRVAVGLALLMTILTEMLAGNSGLGYLVLENQRSFRIREMYAWLVILAIVGLLINIAMAKVERRWVPWLDQRHET
ncbi:MAG TPA: ABC transporter permease [Pseudolabrys sp.]|jgi:ABC-type nitrate/sulfonate/bicarbonate transport system permease component